jgi:hypothetical protein
MVRREETLFVHENKLNGEREGHDTQENAVIESTEALDQRENTLN